MKSLFFPRIHYEFNFYSANPLSIRFFVANSVWIHFLLRVFTIHLANMSWIQYLFRTSLWIQFFFANSLRIYFTLYTIDQTARNGPFWTILAHFWTLVTFYDIIWPQIILNLNSRPNSESKHMYIWYISISRPDSTPIGQVWPGLAGRTSSAFVRRPPPSAF